MTSGEIPDFDFFIDREKNRPCLVAGNAPTLMQFPFKDFEGVYILTGSGPQILKGLACPNYWVNANHICPVPEKHLTLINSFKDCIFIFSDSAAYWAKNSYNHDFLTEHLKIPWFAFDERHFNHQKCQPVKNCCRLVDLYPERKTLPEILEEHFGVREIYRSVGTAVIHSLAFAILMGCSPIYLHGIELPLYAKDYTYFRVRTPGDVFMTLRALKARIQERITGKVKPSDFHDNIEQILSDFKRLIEICHNNGREIYNLSQTSTLKRIHILPYKSPKEI